MTLDQLKELFVQIGARELYAKTLAENDNSKNQVYFGPNFQALNLFPNEEIISESNCKNPIFKAKIRFGWLTEDGKISRAPGAQFILYPQYPEVRFSGFLKGCAKAPSMLMSGRMRDRILFLAVTHDRQVVGYVTSSETEIAAGFRSISPSGHSGVFVEVGLPAIPDETASRTNLLSELRRIHNLGWIDSKQLGSDGILMPCNAPQCGGFTLEAELGIAKNSAAEPDFLGWEVKQHSVPNFRSTGATAITLMTPEPTGGFYRTHGIEAFIRKFGYADKNNKPDRLNFGGIHRIGKRHPTTGLTMQIVGYDKLKNKITDANGSIVLINDLDEIVAEWAFSGLFAHWSRKHARAVYVPSIARKFPKRQYAYGSRIRLCQRTDPLFLLSAFLSGVVYYDPGIKLEQVSAQPKVKRRSQFRIASKNICTLYESVETVDLCSND